MTMENIKSLMPQSASQILHSVSLGETRSISSVTKPFSLLPFPSELTDLIKTDTSLSAPEGVPHDVSVLAQKEEAEEERRNESSKSKAKLVHKAEEKLSPNSSLPYTLKQNHGPATSLLKELLHKRACGKNETLLYENNTTFSYEDKDKITVSPEGKDKSKSKDNTTFSSEDKDKSKGKDNTKYFLKKNKDYAEKNFADKGNTKFSFKLLKHRRKEYPIYLRNPQSLPLEKAEVQSNSSTNSCEEDTDIHYLYTEDISDVHINNDNNIMTNHEKCECCPTIEHNYSICSSLEVLPKDDMIYIDEVKTDNDLLMNSGTCEEYSTTFKTSERGEQVVVVNPIVDSFKEMEEHKTINTSKKANENIIEEHPNDCTLHSDQSLLENLPDKICNTGILENDPPCEWKIESVYSLAAECNNINDNQACFATKSNQIPSTARTLEQCATFSVSVSDNKWKQVCRPSFVVLERLPISKKERPRIKDIISKCSQHCRLRTLDMLCNLNLLTGCRRFNSRNINENAEKGNGFYHSNTSQPLKKENELLHPSRINETHDEMSNPLYSFPSDNNERLCNLLTAQDSLNTSKKITLAVRLSFEQASHRLKCQILMKRRQMRRRKSLRLRSLLKRKSSLPTIKGIPVDPMKLIRNFNFTQNKIVFKEKGGNVTANDKALFQKLIQSDNYIKAKLPITEKSKNISSSPATSLKRELPGRLIIGNATSRNIAQSSSGNDGTTSYPSSEISAPLMGSSKNKPPTSDKPLITSSALRSLLTSQDNIHSLFSPDISPSLISKNSQPSLTSQTIKSLLTYQNKDSSHISPSVRSLPTHQNKISSLTSPAIRSLLTYQNKRSSLTSGIHPSLTSPDIRPSIISQGNPPSLFPSVIRPSPLSSSNQSSITSQGNQPSLIPILSGNQTSLIPISSGNQTSLIPILSCNQPSLIPISSCNQPSLASVSSGNQSSFIPLSDQPSLIPIIPLPALNQPPLISIGNQPSHIPIIPIQSGSQPSCIPSGNQPSLIQLVKQPSLIPISSGNQPSLISLSNQSSLLSPDSQPSFIHILPGNQPSLISTHNQSDSPSHSKVTLTPSSKPLPEKNIHSALATLAKHLQTNPKGLSDKDYNYFMIKSGNQQLLIKTGRIEMNKQLPIQNFNNYKFVISKPSNSDTQLQKNDTQSVPFIDNGDSSACVTKESSSSITTFPTNLSTDVNPRSDEFSSINNNGNFITKTSVGQDTITDVPIELPKSTFPPNKVSTSSTEDVTKGFSSNSSVSRSKLKRTLMESSLLTMEERKKIKRTILESKYPLPPGVVIKAEPIAEGYDLDNSWSVTSEMNMNYSPENVGPQFGNVVANAIERHYENISSSQDGFSKSVNECDDLPPLLENVTEWCSKTNSIRDQEDGSSLGAESEEPPILQPMPSSTSLSLTENALDLEVEGDSDEDDMHNANSELQTKRSHHSLNRQDSSTANLNCESGYDSLSASSSSEALMSTSSSTSIHDTNASGQKSSVFNSKIQQLKELLRKSEIQVENMRKIRSSLPQVDLDSV